MCICFDLAISLLEIKSNRIVTHVGRDVGSRIFITMLFVTVSTGITLLFSNRVLVEEIMAHFYNGTLDIIYNFEEICLWTWKYANNILIRDECELWNKKYHALALTICMYRDTQKNDHPNNTLQRKYNRSPICNLTFSSYHITKGKKTLI